MTERAKRPLPAKVAYNIASDIGLSKVEYRKFAHSLKMAMGATNGENRQKRGIQARAIRSELSALRKRLERISSQSPASRSAWAAGRHLCAAAPSLSIDELIRATRVAELNATEKPNTRLRGAGPPTGTRGSSSFDMLLHHLYALEDLYGFAWTAGKHDDSGEAIGSLPRALSAMAPYLPEGFVPNIGSTLIKAIDRVRAKTD
jgi:hypothetical protein